jgi:hypothetical protein
MIDSCSTYKRLIGFRRLRDAKRVRVSQSERAQSGSIGGSGGQSGGARVTRGVEDHMMFSCDCRGGTDGVFTTIVDDV